MAEPPFFPGDDDEDTTPPVGVPKLKAEDWVRIQAQFDRILALHEEVKRKEREAVGLRAEVYERGQRIEKLQKENRELRDAMVRWRDKAAQLEQKIRDLAKR